MKSICVYCGSSPGDNPIYLENAKALGTRLALEGITVVYGGASVGLMGAVADSCLDAGGKVIGVLPEILLKRELEHKSLTEMYIVDSMHTRKAKMAELSDGFIALPGGFGTFEELCEVATWSQIGLHKKPIGALNVGGYYDPLEKLILTGIKEGFMTENYKNLIVFRNSVDELMTALENYIPLPAPKWATAEEA